MSWVKDNKYKWYENLAINIIKMGPIPRHVAFIMDGNRRFAKNSRIDKIEGHTKGFAKLTECLRWCLDVGVEEVTTFAFSIENFKRSEDEVSALMDLARSKFESLLNEKDHLNEKGLRIRVMGNISLLPVDIQALIAEAMLLTEKNDKLFLNIAFAYTSHEEMTNAVQSVLEEGEELHPEDIDENLLRHCLYSEDSRDPDLLVRTSGETRISDFLMWQISATVLYFTKVFWPAITLWHFIFAIFRYQRATSVFSSFKTLQQPQSTKTKELLPERVQNFIRRIQARRRDYLVNLANSKLKGD